MSLWDLSGRLLRGEYWIMNGDVAFADGEVGDFNHESYAIQEACRSIISHLNLRDQDEPHWEGVEMMFNDWWKQEHDEELDPDAFDDEMTKCLDANSSMQLEEITALIRCARASFKCDARSHATRYWKWQWVKGRHIGTYRLTEEDCHSIEKGLSEILDQEGIELDDENMMNESIEIQVEHTAQRYSFSLDDILTEKWREQIPAREKLSAGRDAVLDQISIGAVGPNAQLAAADKELEHPYYQQRDR